MFVWLGKVLAFSQLTALPPKAQPKAKPSSTSEVYDSLSLLLIKLILLLLLYPLVMTYNCEIFMSDSMLFHLTETTDTVTSLCGSHVYDVYPSAWTVTPWQSQAAKEESIFSDWFTSGCRKLLLQGETALVADRLLQLPVVWVEDAILFANIWQLLAKLVKTKTVPSK